MMAKKQKFDFKAACEAMLRRLGATTGTHHDLAIPTVAGLLQCTPYADWLACAFDDVQAARAKVGHGTLNQFSGKWNWMYDKPGPHDLAHLYTQLASVLSPGAEAAKLLDEYTHATRGLHCDGEINTRLSYMYRDADNYKVGRTVVFAGRYRLSEDLVPLVMALDHWEGESSFIPGQIGLSDLQDSFQGCESRWDPERDHPWHTVTGIVPVAAQEFPATDCRSIFEFTQDVIRVVTGDGWNEAYLPPSYPAMKERQDRYAEEQLAQEAASHDPMRERQAG